jgi:parvulin-like peptidyl-prolyl isomerase
MPSRSSAAPPPEGAPLHRTRGALAALGLLVAVASSNGEVIERVVARVNGQIITLSEFQARQAAAVQQNRIPDDQIEPFLRENNQRLLDEAMEELLLIDRGLALGLKLRPEAIDQIVEDIKKEQNIVSEEQFQAQLRQEGLTLDSLKRNIERSIIVRQVRQREIEPKAQLAEADVRAEYEKRKATDYTRKASAHLYEIVLSGESAARDAARAHERLVKGEDFESVAREVSTSPSRAAGGDLGRIEPADLSAPLAAAVAALEPGRFSAPIPGENSARILKVRERLPDQVTPFEQVKEALHEEMARAKFEKAYDAYIAEHRKNAVWQVMIREAPVRLAGRGPRDRPTPAVSGDDEISTSGSSAPERVTVPPPPVPTPTVRP